MEPDIKTLKKLVEDFDTLFSFFTPLAPQKAGSYMLQLKTAVGEPEMKRALDYYAQKFSSPSSEEIRDAAENVRTSLAVLNKRLDRAFDIVSSRAYEREYEARYGEPPADARFSKKIREAIDRLTCRG